MRDAESEAALAAAFEKGRAQEVTRLHRRDDLPEENLWLRGKRVVPRLSLNDLPKSLNTVEKLVHGNGGACLEGFALRRKVAESSRPVSLQIRGTPYLCHAEPAG